MIPRQAPDVEALELALVEARDWIRALADDLERWVTSARDIAKEIDDTLDQCKNGDDHA